MTGCTARVQLCMVVAPSLRRQGRPRGVLRGAVCRGVLLVRDADELAYE